MLMVPIIKKTNTIHKNNNIEHLIEKHAQFYSKLDYAKNLDFSQIDHRDKRLKMTIREMIMEINSLDGKNTKLFWSIDENKEGIFITFPSFVGEQARNTIAQLPSLLCFIHGIEVLSFMTPAAQRRALAAPWDKEMHCTKSPEIESVGNLLSKIDNIKFVTAPKNQYQSIQIKDITEY